MLRTTAKRAAVCSTFLPPDFKALLNARIVLLKNATDGGLDQWPVQSTGTADLAEERKREEREKGCGLGYALAVNSCEGVSSVDACTVAAPDAITALAVPNPSCSSQSSWFFRVWWLNEFPHRANHPAYFGPVNITCTNPFSRRLSQVKRSTSGMQ